MTPSDQARLQQPAVPASSGDQSLHRAEVSQVGPSGTALQHTAVASSPEQEGLRFQAAHIDILGSARVQRTGDYAKPLHEQCPQRCISGAAPVQPLAAEAWQLPRSRLHQNSIQIPATWLHAPAASSCRAAPAGPKQDINLSAPMHAILMEGVALSRPCVKVMLLQYTMCTPGRRKSAWMFAPSRSSS